jgi:hypothetical protein
MLRLLHRVPIQLPMSSSPASPWPAPTPDQFVWPVEDAAEPLSVSPKASTTAISSLVKRLSGDERAQRAAIKAECKLLHQVEDLPSAFFVLHSVDIGQPGRPIDHVVIGAGGVFTLHLEHHPRAKVWVSEHAVMIDGRATEHLRHARFGARRCSKLLSDACGFDVAVQSVLVLIGASNVQAANRPAEVHVRTELDLRDWLCRQPPRVDADTVAAIHRQARFVETWRPHAT